MLLEMVTLVTGGDDVYAFDDREAAGVQALVMIGANLDVDTFEVPADVWESVRDEIAAGIDGQIIEMFTPVEVHPEAAAMVAALGREMRGEGRCTWQ